MSEVGVTASEPPPPHYEAPKPPNEAVRLAEVLSLNQFNTPNEERIDIFTRLVTRILKCPAAGVSLIADEDIFYKSLLCEGFPPTLVYPRKAAICSHVVAHEKPQALFVPDLTKSEMFYDHPTVLGGPKWGFYAGVPLISRNGRGLGSLCAMDHVPHPDFSEDEKRIMEDLSRMVTQELETNQENRDVKAINQIQKRENRSLQATNDLLVRALSVSSEGIVMFDEKLKIIYANDGWTRMTGVTRTDAEGREMLDLVEVQSRGEIEALIVQLLSGKVGSSTIESECLTRTGENLWIRFQMSAFTDESEAKLMHVICVLSDISALKQEQFNLIKAKEEAERATRAAEVASQAKTNFLTNMSHELRTPLHGILGCIHVLARSLLSPEQRKWVVTIQKSCAVLCDIVNDLLDMSKIAVRKMKIDKHPFDLAGVAEEVTEITASNALQKQLDVAAFIPANCMVPILGDKARVQRVLMNYVSNAIKFTSKGCVVLRAQLVGATATHVTMRFTVTDTGIGIRKEDQSLLFHRFSQIDEGPARQFGGTGLGLALAKELANLMNGDAGVESEFGKGATFWCTAVFERQVPLVPAPAPVAAVPSSPRSTTSGGAPSPVNPILKQRRASAVAAQQQAAADAAAAAAASAGSSSPRTPVPASPSTKDKEPLLQVAGLGDQTLSGFTADEVRGSLSSFAFVVVHPLPFVSSIIHDLLVDSGAQCQVEETAEGGLKAVRQIAERISKMNDDAAHILIALVDERVPGAREFCVTVFNEQKLEGALVIFMSGEDKTAQGLPIAATLRKPFTRTALIQALAEIDMEFEDASSESAALSRSASGTGSMIGAMGAGARILVVDDNDTNLLVAAESLRTLGYHHVTTAATGAGAVEMFQAALRTQPYDVILLDIHMPGDMDGFATCKAIRDIERAMPSASEHNMLPILAMTAGVTKDELQLCSEAGFTRILDKPWTMDKLESLLNRCLLARRGVAPHATDNKGSAFKLARVGSVDTIAKSIGGNFTGTTLTARAPSPPVAQPYATAPPPPLYTIHVAVKNMIASMMLCQMLAVEALVPRMAADLNGIDLGPTATSTLLGTTDNGVAGDPTCHVIFAEADAPDFESGLSKLSSTSRCVVIALTPSGNLPQRAALLVDTVALKVPYTPDALQAALRTAQQLLLAQSIPQMDRTLDRRGDAGVDGSGGGGGLRGALLPNGGGAPPSPSGPTRKQMTRKRSLKAMEIQRLTATTKSAVETLEESQTDTEPARLWGAGYDKDAIAGTRLLVVDDTPLNVVMMTQYLRDVGFVEVDVAENGLIATEKYSAALSSPHPYDLVLMDILMPVMDGYQAVARIREMERTAGIDATPVIAVTANNSAADKERCLSHGVTDYLGKPYEANQLYQIMNTHLFKC